MNVFIALLKVWLIVGAIAIVYVIVKTVLHNRMVKENLPEPMALDEMEDVLGGDSIKTKKHAL